jgi:hypothetical protein
MGSGVYVRLPLRRSRARLVRVVTASTATITASDTPVDTSGTEAWCRCAKCSTSLTPMNTRITASPVDRYTRRSSKPETTKYSARRPSSANTFAASTM